MYMKLNLVNKREYEENRFYKEIVITIPKSFEELKKDFEYLGLDYENLSIQDSHITNVEVIDIDNPEYSNSMSRVFNNINVRGDESGYTTPFQDVKAIYSLINNLSAEEKEKLLAVLTSEKENIVNMNSAIKYIKHLNDYELDCESNSEEEYAENAINNGELDMDDIMDYIDLETLGNNLLDSRNSRITEYGVLTHIVDRQEELEDEEEI